MVSHYSEGESYQEAGVGSLAKLIVLEGQGHNYFECFFHSQVVQNAAHEGV